jgi:predicted nucleotide-binding protein (sugar kinase/HSP70/actin superfamily)
MRVGIPRAMGYYYLYPFFRTLLLQLGADPVLSPPTSRRLLERMDACPTDEPCLAVKLHFSHAEALITRDDIDCLLLPIIARVEQTICCPKFIGVADMIRHGLRLEDAQVLMPVLDYTQDDPALWQALWPTAQRLGVTTPGVLTHAIACARQAQAEAQALCAARQFTTPEAYRFLETQQAPALPLLPPDAPTVAVIGHPYLIYEIVSQGMIETLRLHTRVVTAEMVPEAAVMSALTAIPEGKQLWPFEAMLLGAALHLLHGRQIDKLILVGSFECGPESIIETYIEEAAHAAGIPLMVLALDEHSGEAGLQTRLEAFLDTDKLPQDAVPEPAPILLPLTQETMVLGFPSMGDLDSVMRHLVESFGVRALPTPPTTRTCIELGRELSPEFACFPFIATLGQMRLLLEQGANTLLMVGGKGYCRLGWYAQIQERLLRRMGYDFRLLTLESPFPLRDRWTPFARVFKTLTNDAPWPRILWALLRSYRQLAAMDRVTASLHRLRAFERTPGSAEPLATHALARLRQAEDCGHITRLEREFTAATAAVELAETDPLRVRIAGEIWVILEQTATRNLERWLGSRERPRVWVDRPHSVSQWLDLHLLGSREALRREETLLAAARPWLSHKVGGHGQATIGEVARATAEGIDGVIHVFPFTCMPEIIAQNILVRVAESHDIPVLTYIVSEQTGEAGMETRLEAFLDLLDERRLARRTPA